MREEEKKNSLVRRLKKSIFLHYRAGFEIGLWANSVRYKVSESMEEHVMFQLIWKSLFQYGALEADSDPRGFTVTSNFIRFA